MIRNVRRMARLFGYTMTCGTSCACCARISSSQPGRTPIAVRAPARRWLRAVAHRLRTGGPATLTPAQLEGWRGLAAMIEKQRAPLHAPLA